MISKQSTKNLVESFFGKFFILLDAVYGEAFEVWWNKQGKENFYQWAEKEGLKFADIDFDIFGKSGFKLNFEQSEKERHDKT